MKAIFVHELRQQLKQGKSWLILDVRQPEEFSICNFQEVGETMLLPLNELHAATDRIPKERPIAVCCHHGVRSKYAIQYLEQLGFHNLYNLEGGIHAWAMEVDTLMSVY